MHFTFPSCLLPMLGMLLFVAGCERPCGPARLGPARIDDISLAHADSDPANWLMYGRTYDEQRFSPLDEINETTIARLGLLWTRELGDTRGLEATPLVVDGAIFTTGSWSVVYAIDAVTGQIRWTYDPGVNRDRARIH